MLDQVLEAIPTFSVDNLLLLGILVALESVLSADNAIALAALVQGIEDPRLQKQALNLGLVAAFILRMALILTASWVIKFWQFELAGALYLLWLAGQYFLSNDASENHHHGPTVTTLWQIIPLLAFTDLAFSLDSVTTAIAVSEDRWIVLTGGMIGIITLRFMAGLFIRWLKEFTHLQDAGYLTVTLVGLRLLLKVFDSHLVPPEWLMILAIGLCFLWGFSQHQPQLTAEIPVNSVLNLSSHAETIPVLNGQLSESLPEIHHLESVFKVPESLTSDQD
jgi:YkoY family integral membrane protein